MSMNISSACDPANSAATTATSEVQHRHHHGGHKTEQAVDAAVSKLFGISTDELSSDLASGKTMQDIAKDKGISSDTLLATIGGAVSSSRASAAPKLSDDQLQKISTDIASGVKGPGRRHHRPAVDPAASAAATVAPAPVPGVNAATGTSTDSVVSALGVGRQWDSLL